MGLIGDWPLERGTAEQKVAGYRLWQGDIFFHWLGEQASEGDGKKTTGAEVIERGVIYFSRRKEDEFLEEEILKREEIFRYEHCGFPIHLPYYIMLHAFFWWFFGFHQLLGYFIALFSLPSSSSIHFKDKPGYDSSYATDHGARLFWHEMGSYESFVCLFIILKVLCLRSFVSVFFFCTSIFVFQHTCGVLVSHRR